MYKIFYQIAPQKGAGSRWTPPFYLPKIKKQKYFAKMLYDLLHLLPLLPDTYTYLYYTYNINKIISIIESMDKKRGAGGGAGGAGQDIYYLCRPLSDILPYLWIVYYLLIY